MSVINQMLKDLDDRQSDLQHSQSAQIPQKKQRTSWKLITFFVIIVIVLNIAGVFIWQLYSENQSLKSAYEPLNANKQRDIEYKKSQTLTNRLEQKTPISKSEISTVKKEEIVLSDLENTSLSKNVESHPEVTVGNEPLINQKIDAAIEKDPQPINQKAIQTTNNNNVLVNKVAEDAVNDKATSKPTLSISRKQLTPVELTQQKIDQAEQALAENKLSRAEQLFEDVILMIPEHKIARKKLAALWFGRQAYQSAINLLSQGIQLYPEDREFRLMKARIYFNQGQTTAGVNTLKALPKVENVEYQALLASHAQQISQFDIAARAYQLLTTLEPNAGRWWLGLAVAHDSNSEFEQATRAYQQATTKNDLSENAKQFARQRVQELGE
ncbi:tetratricopeptide repeat protein [Thalassotalea castellviae]|uniref:Tetratricopeptide repeat protein n=1 Tax=Thalassotalea castellviae TaxID=3075612 RepID=A0ABU3A2W0_9GAMM|nr:tetratricopeptide repeat protein [Thalassotalea sp. W431]MDT0603301.1 tetratricopeptide repeat protein [Thalassotalea sp. W431]